MQPYSGVDHEARFTQTIAGTDKSVSHTYKGQGGLSKAAWSNGVLIGKNYMYMSKLAFILEVSDVIQPRFF